MVQKKQRWCKTVRELCAELSISEQAFYAHWKKRPDAPKHTSKGYSLVEWLEYYEAAQEARLDGIVGPDGDYKREKLRLECEILKQKLAVLKGESMPIAEHLIELQDIGAVVNAGLDEFVQWVTVEFRAAKTTARAKAIRDRTKKWIQKEMAKT